MALVVRLPAAALVSPCKSQPNRRARLWITGCSLSSTADPAWLPEQQPGSRRPRSIAGVDQAVLVEPWLLAEPDSRFADYNGVQVHYKIVKSGSGEQHPQNSSSVDAAGNVKVPAVLLHGFGASVFSWERLMRPLSEALASAVVAFDRPGFGLTSRPSVVPNAKMDNPYSLDFSASIAVAFADFLRADKVILVGHSAGCIVAADAYFKAPERIAGIVMLAPAIPAPFRGQRRSRQRDPGDDQGGEQAKAPLSRAAILVKLVSTLFLALRAVAVDLFTQLFQRVVDITFARTLAFALRSGVAISLLQQIMDRYATTVVRSAWFNPQKVDGYVIRGYTKPLQCRNWEQGLLEFVIATFSSTETKRWKLADRIQDIACPVLIITGDTDRLVPAWNARRLAKCFPVSRFHLIKECGHLPHEETPDEVIRVIGEFVSSCIAKVKSKCCE